MKKKSPISKERMIEIIEAKLQDPRLSGREFTSLTKRLSNLQGWVKQGEYVRKSQQQNPQSEPPKPLPLPQPLWIVRGDLVESVANRLRNSLEQVLTPEEIEAASVANLTPDTLLVAAKDYIWDNAHPDEVRELLELSSDDPPLSAFTELLAAVKTDQPGSWVAYLKAFPKVTVNAGPTLTPEELRDVQAHRSAAAAARDQKKRDIYERFPDRFLHGHRTVAETP